MSQKFSTAGKCETKGGKNLSTVINLNPRKINDQCSHTNDNNG